VLDEVHVRDVDHIDGPGAFDLEAFELCGIAHIQEQKVLGSGEKLEKFPGSKTVYTHNCTSRVVEKGEAYVVYI
jgi:hypothetical protein